MKGSSSTVTLALRSGFLLNVRLRGAGALKTWKGLAVGSYVEKSVAKSTVPLALVLESETAAQSAPIKSARVVLRAI